MPERLRGIINEAGLVPVSIVAVVASFAFWFSHVQSSTEANYAAIAELSLKTQEDFTYIRAQRQSNDTLVSDRMRDTEKVLREITDRLGRIEGTPPR